jgi:hypothetical protein
MSNDEACGNARKRRKICDNSYYTSYTIPSEVVDMCDNCDSDTNSDNRETISEIENIVESRENNGIIEYKIKWACSKSLTWITENDFIEKEALEEFKEYEKRRNDPNVINKGYIYCRTSKRSGDRGVSLYVQEQQCLDFAKKNNINIVGCHRDDGVSARNSIKKQRGLLHIKEKIQKGDILIFYEISRFSRCIDDAIELLEYLRNTVGAVVYSVSDKCVWDNNESNRLNFVKNLEFSKHFSDMTSKKVKDAINFKRSRGDYMAIYK